MFPPRFRPFLTLWIFCAAAVYGVAADPPQVPQDSHQATPAPTKDKDQAGKAAPAGNKAQTPAASGVVVFVDPATGQIRQPSAAEIGDLSPATGTVAPKAPEPALMQGPGGSVGARLGEDSLTYMVVTASPDGKLAMDCVTGSKAADATVRAITPVTPPVTKVPPSKTPGPQDSHEIKVPR